MRLTLDTARNLVLELPSDSAAPDHLPIVLGDPSIALNVFDEPVTANLGDNGNLVDGGAVEFAAKSAISGSAVVAGSIAITTAPDDPQILDLGEDWKSAAVVALFSTDKPYVDLVGQWRWRNGGETFWNHSPLVPIRLANSLFIDDIIPGASVVAAPYLYLSSIDAYVESDTSLESIAGANIPAGTIIQVVIVVGGLQSESRWLVVKPPTEATDVAGGLIALLDGTAHLVRVSGL